MTVVSIGSVIKEYRNRAGLTQIELCEGLCEPPTFSKIENNQQNPSKKLLDAIVERLNIPLNLNVPVAKVELDRACIETEILSNLSRNDYSNIEELLTKYKSLSTDLNKFEEQFYLYVHAVLSRLKKQNINTVLKELEKSLLLTFPSFNIDKDFSKHLFTSVEISILNNIAICHFIMNNIDISINILNQLVINLEKTKTGSEIFKIKYPMITCNLSAWLGIKGKYIDGAEISRKGINCCKKYERYSSLGDLLYNHGYTLMMLHNAEEGKKYLRKSIFFAAILSNNHSIQNAKKDIEDSFGQEMWKEISCFKIPL